MKSPEDISQKELRFKAGDMAYTIMGEAGTVVAVFVALQFKDGPLELFNEDFLMTQAQWDAKIKGDNK